MCSLMKVVFNLLILFNPGVVTTSVDVLLSLPVFGLNAEPLGVLV